MKKHFTKIVATSLLIALVPLTSGFCFQGMFNPTVQISEVQAAEFDVNTTVNDMDACGEAKTPNPARQETPKTNNHHSVMPCCVDGTHTGIVSIAQAIEKVEAVPLAIIPVRPEPLNPILTLFSYRTPIISPPELVSVRTTILRL